MSTSRPTFQSSGQSARSGDIASANFDAWFAAYLQQSPIQVTRLLRDKTSIRFLIAWSLLETSCFNGFAKGADLEKHCKRISKDEGFSSLSLMQVLRHFHGRYQDQTLHANLMHGHSNPDIRPLLNRPVESLSEAERLYFLVSVVYRYRNNIFHGAKGVESWLRFKPQIEYCTQIMQALITHASGLARDTQNVAAYCIDAY